MARKKLIALLAVFSIVLGSLCGCVWPGAATQPPQHGGKNKITVSIKAVVASSRTIANADPVVSSYALSGGPSGSGQSLLGTYASLTGATLELSAGTWDFTLQGLDAGSNVVLQGTQNGVVLSTTPVTITFTLRTLTTGTGTVSVAVSWPSTVPVASVVTTFAGTLVSPALTITELERHLHQLHGAGRESDPQVPDERRRRAPHEHGL